MKSVLKAAAVVSALVVGAGVANANDELKRLIADENNWATPTKDYAATRYSKLAVSYTHLTLPTNREV